ncbi:MAG: YicC/YloC family endoribonuclease [Flavobacteriaceae bacterium]
MMQSMTGFGKAETTFEDKKITLEIRSLNSKNLDLNTRLPSFYKEMEAEFRKKIIGTLNRGKVDLALFYEANASESASEINIPVVQAYMEQLASFDLEESEKLKIAIRLPDTLKAERESISTTEKKAVLSLADEVLQKITNFRQQEGESLQQDILERITKIGQFLETVKTVDSQRIKKVRERLQNSLDELEVKVDENRFEQELIYYLEKFDITEEKVRLENHLSYFKEIANTGHAQGKKLGFVAQEIGREINTIGSKANDAALQKIVVQMKDELEKIKEQLLNVL